MSATFVPTVTQDLTHTSSKSGAASRSLRNKLDDALSVKDFGAKGDGQRVLTGTTSNGSATLTATGAGFTLADVGKVILVEGAGAAGVNLLTTIASVTNSTTVVLTAPASTAIAGSANFTYGSDDTAAINAAISAIPSYSANTTLLFPGGTYFSQGGHVLQYLIKPVVQGNGSKIIYTGAGSTTPLFYVQGCDSAKITDFEMQSATIGVGYGVSVRHPSSSIGWTTAEWKLANLKIRDFAMGVEVGRAGDTGQVSDGILELVLTGNCTTGIQQDGAATEVITYIRCEPSGGTTRFNLISLSATMIGCTTGGSSAGTHYAIGGAFRNLVMINPHAELKNSSGLLFSTSGGNNYITIIGGSLSNFNVTTGNSIATFASGGVLNLVGTIIYSQNSGVLWTLPDGALNLQVDIATILTNVSFSGLTNAAKYLTKLVAGYGLSNQLALTGGGTGAATTVEAAGSDSNVNIDIQPKGTGLVTIGRQQANYWQVQSIVTTGSPTLSVVGSDSDIILSLVSKGTGGIRFNGGTPIAKHLSATKTWDPGNVITGAQTSTTVSVTSAAVGDTVAVGFSNAVPAGALLVGAVTSSGTVTVTLLNFTGSDLDLASGTLRADAWQH